MMDPASIESFDYVMTTLDDASQLQPFLSKPFDWKMQTSFGSGAIVEKSTSSLNLVRIRIQTFDKENRAKLLEIFAAAAADLAIGNIDTSIRYIERGRYVGWVFYHPI